MSVLDIIRKRRSTRKYLDRPVEKEKISACLEAARLAPSACNGQPWKFIVVDDPLLKNELCDKAFSGAYSMNQFARQAPVIVAVVSEREKFFVKAAGYIRRTSFYLVDIGIACEHFVLQAEDLGLGTCWLGWFDEKEVKKILKVPRLKKVDMLISLGYPEPIERGEHTRNSLEEMSSFNRY